MYATTKAQNYKTHKQLKPIMLEVIGVVLSVFNTNYIVFVTHTGTAHTMELRTLTRF